MNIGNNFADMRDLPRSIGNFDKLEGLNISNNQIRIPSDSFRMITQLHNLRVKENPLEVPPRHIAETGAQAVVLSWLKKIIHWLKFKEHIMGIIGTITKPYKKTKLSTIIFSSLLFHCNPHRAKRNDVFVCPKGYVSAYSIVQEDFQLFNWFSCLRWS